MSHQYVSNEEIPDKQDYPKPDERLAARLTNAGVPTAMATFSRAFGTLAPEGTGKWLLIDAAIAAAYGMTDDQVLRAMTLVPAQILGVADRVLAPLTRDARPMTATRDVLCILLALQGADSLVPL